MWYWKYSFQISEVNYELPSSKVLKRKLWRELYNTLALGCFSLSVCTLSARYTFVRTAKPYQKQQIECTLYLCRLFCCGQTFFLRATHFLGSRCDTCQSRPDRRLRSHDRDRPISWSMVVLAWALTTSEPTPRKCITRSMYVFKHFRTWLHNRTRCAALPCRRRRQLPEYWFFLHIVQRIASLLSRSWLLAF